MFTKSSESGAPSDVLIRRDGMTKLVVSTSNALTDDQMEDLYWIVLLMNKTGMSLKELRKEGIIWNDILRKMKEEEVEKSK